MLAILSILFLNSPEYLNPQQFMWKYVDTLRDEANLFPRIRVRLNFDVLKGGS